MSYHTVLRLCVCASMRGCMVAWHACMCCAVLSPGVICPMRELASHFCACVRACLRACVRACVRAFFSFAAAVLALLCLP